MLPNLKIRPANPDDINFVMSTWKRTWRTSPWAGCIRNDEYFKSIGSTIEGLIARGSELLVAESESGRLLGWCCHETLADSTCCIHYIYVKDPYISLGIGDQLVAATPGTKPGFYTFRYSQVAEACKHSEGWRHRPEIARRR